VLDLPGPGDDEAFERRVLEYSKDSSNRWLKALLVLEKLELRDPEQFALFMDRLLLTCGNCMLVCWPDMKDRKENHSLLMRSGRVVKDETGIRIVHV